MWKRVEVFTLLRDRDPCKLPLSSVHILSVSVLVQVSGSVNVPYIVDAVTQESNIVLVLKPFRFTSRYRYQNIKYLPEEFWHWSSSNYTIKSNHLTFVNLLVHGYLQENKNICHCLISAFSYCINANSNQNKFV